MSIEKTIAEIEKAHGKGSIMPFSSRSAIVVETIPTGSLALDTALGVGGLPRGRICELYGPESSGKSTLAMTAVSQAQKMGGLCAYVDMEHCLDPDYSQSIGVNLEALLISQPDFAEQALSIVEALCNSGSVSIIVIDSVAALVPKAELEGEMGDAIVGVQARLMSQAMRKLTGAAAKNKTTLLFINQIREKIGVMFGSPETTTGGKALKFYSSIRMDIRRTGQIKDGDKVIGNRTRVKIVKNKLAPPFREAEFDIIFGKGINTIGDALDIAVEKSIVEKSGAWYSFAGQRIGQGRDKTMDYLTNEPTIFESILEKTRAALKS